MVKNTIFFMNRSTSTIVCVDFKGYHTLCLSESGYVFSLGYSMYGAHGHKHKLSLPKKISSLNNIRSVVGRSHTMCLDYDGNVYSFGSIILDNLVLVLIKIH